jgi:WD40 repeat protein
MRCFGLFLLAIIFSAPALHGASGDTPFLVLDAGGHMGIVRQVLFTPNGKELITVSEDKAIRIWDVTRGDPIRVLRSPIGPGTAGVIHAEAISPNGKTLAVSYVGLTAPGEAIIALIGLDSGKIDRLLKGHTGLIYSLAFAPDGQRLASGSTDQTICIWDVATGTCAKTLRGHSSRVLGVAFSPDGKRLASASFDRTARIWSIADGQSLAILRGHEKEVRCVAWSQDGGTLATGSYDHTVRLWNADGSLRRRIDRPGGWVLSVTFSPDSRSVLLTQSHSRGCALLDVSSGKEQVGFSKHSGAVFSGAISPDGSLAASCGGEEREIYLWRTTNGGVVSRFAGRGRSAFSAAWSQDGTALGWGNKNEGDSLKANKPLHRSFRLRDLEFGLAPDEHYDRARTTLGPLALEYLDKTTVGVRRGDAIITRLKLSNDYDMVVCFSLLPENRAVIGSAYGLLLFDTHSGKLVRTFHGHNNEIWAVAPSPDNRYLLSASGDQTLRIWTLDRDEPLLSLFFAGDDWIAWTPQGNYAASPGGEKLMGWQVNNDTDQLASFYPAEKFRKSLYRPDVIKRLLTAGSVEKALEQADQARGQSSKPTQVNDVLPPRVRITTPDKNGQKLDQAELRVEALASSVGQHSVTALRLLLDGRPYAGQAGLQKVRQPKLGEVRMSWTIALTPGRHRLAVQADSAVSQATSEEVEVLYHGNAEPDRDRPAVKLYVLAVGINAYPEKLKLRCAAHDAQAITQAFQDKSRPLFRQVEARLLTDDKATRKGVLDGLGWLRKEMTQRDVAVVFFAGHGAKDSEGSLYLLPADVDPDNLLTTGIPGDQLKKALAGLPGRVLFLLDACHAGAAGDDRRRASEPLTDELVQDLATDDYGVVVMCAAMSREFSRESAKLGHGFFTQAVVEGLQGKGPRSSEGAVYLHHLDGYVTDRVKELTGGLQHPVTAKPTSVRSFPLSKP